MKISVKYPVMVRVDSVGAILMVSNIMTTSHSKHMDFRCKYVNKHVEDGIVMIIFKSTDNDSDILTNNLSAKLHAKHSKNMMG